MQCQLLHYFQAPQLGGALLKPSNAGRHNRGNYDQTLVSRLGRSLIYRLLVTSLPVLGLIAQTVNALTDVFVQGVDLVVRRQDRNR